VCLARVSWVELTWSGGAARLTTDPSNFNHYYTQVTSAPTVQGSSVRVSVADG
jgi:hypothetical protein